MLGVSTPLCSCVRTISPARGVLEGYVNFVWKSAKGQVDLQESSWAFPSSEMAVFSWLDPPLSCVCTETLILGGRVF